MSHRIILPKNYTDADVVAAAEGAIEQALNYHVVARVPEPADLLNNYEEVLSGKAGGLSYSVLRQVRNGDELLHLATLGYFSIVAD